MTLQPYIYCDNDGCLEKHYLTLNQDVQGKWCVGYVEFTNHTAHVALNDFDTIAEALAAMEDQLYADE